MSETKHTPGPWIAKTFASPAGTYYIANSAGVLLIGAGKQMGQADAKLIAAAPDLLAAAKAALPYLCDPAANLGREALETKLRQAIAAAEGR